MASIESIFMYLVAYLPKNQYLSSKKTNKTTSLSFGGQRNNLRDS